MRSVKEVFLADFECHTKEGSWKDASENEESDIEGKVMSTPNGA